MDLHDRLRTVEDENEILRERIFQLEAELFATQSPFPIEWKLTGSESRVFGALVSRKICFKSTIMLALYDGIREAEPKIVDIFICKIRHKLRPFGIEIETVWGQGYALSDATRKSLKSDSTELAA